MAATDLAERVDRETGELLAEEPYRFPEVRIDKKFVTNQLGRDFILSDGLLDGLHQLSGGYFDVDTKIEQLPTGENGQTCVVSATVTVFHPEEGRVLRRASDIGDASPASVGRGILPHLIRMASTRAVSRALRTLLNVGAVAFEELGPAGAEPAQAHENARPASFSAPVVRAPAVDAGAAPRPVETIQVGGRTLSRSQVLDVYHARFTAAETAGLQLAPMGTPGGPPSSDAPLPEIVDYCKELTRRLDSREGGARSAGK
jgi:hypothetical protein